MSNCYKRPLVLAERLQKKPDKENETKFIHVIKERSEMSDTRSWDWHRSNTISCDNFIWQTVSPANDTLSEKVRANN